MYAYGTASNYPTQNWRDANYWVDVVLSATPPVPVTLSSMTVAPANSTITTGSSQQFTATGFYSNGTSQDLTSQVTWASADTGVATIIGYRFVQRRQRWQQHHYSDAERRYRQHESHRTGNSACDFNNIPARRRPECSLFDRPDSPGWSYTLHLVHHQWLITVRFIAR